MQIRRKHRLRPASLLMGAFLWSVIVAANAFLDIAHWANQENTTKIVLIFAFGAALAYPPGLVAAGLIARDRPPSARFAAAFLALSMTTIGITALIFGLEYRDYYAEWHARAFSRIWTLQLVSTLAVAFYQFAVIGLRLYLPFAFIGLFAFSLWFAVAGVDTSRASATTPFGSR